MNEKVLPLSSSVVQVLSQSFTPLTYHHDQIFVYREQFSPAAFILIEGEIHLCEEDRVLQKLYPSQVLGLYQVLHGKRSNFDCKIIAGSKVLVLGKSDLLTAKKNSELEKLVEAVNG